MDVCWGFMKNLTLRNLLLLTLVLSTIPQITAANPTIDEDPDFYSMPGLNTQRSYEVSDNLVVDTFSGTLQTHSVDMTLKGTGPDIVVQRSYNSVPSVLSESSYMGPGWDIHFGRIVGTYTCFNGTYTQNTSKLFYIKPDGTQVQIHGEVFLFADYNENGVIDSTDYVPDLTTSDFWRGECRGNQLVLTDTQGTNYYMGPSDSPDVYAPFVVVKIEDPYSQSINIEYELANAFSRPTRVTSADGRVVEFGYENFNLSSITDGEISVNYFYINNNLERVEFPESFVWQYSYKDSTRLLSEVITPLGAVISIGWDNYFFQNKDYPVVNSKCIEEVCWIYQYEREYDNGETVQDITTITTPYDTREMYYHITPLNVSNGEIWKIGLLTRKEIYRESSGSVDPNDIDPCSVGFGAYNGDTPISSTTYEWDGVLYSWSDRVYLHTGVALFDQDYRKPALKYTEETRNNETYTYEVLSRYVHGAPEIIKETGNITRYTKMYYHSDAELRGNWFIALPSATYVSDDNDEYYFVSGTYFNEFGKIRRQVEQGAGTDFTYDSDGNLYSITDGVENTTYYSEYHRGIPQRVDYPNLTYISREVDDRGRVRSETNQKLITTYYRYDDLDRITRVTSPETYPVEVFYSADGEYKHFTKGYLRETYRYNELGNMIQHTREDLSSGKQLIRTFDYDARNQLTFESIVNDTNGTYYKYSPLGELIKVRTTNDEVVVHEYANYQQTTTDAKCNQTIRSFEATSMSNRQLTNILGPENLDIDIERNLMGQPLTITQDGIIRSYTYYNGSWLLESYKDPEENAVRRYGYNDAAQLTSMTAGPDDNQNNTYAVVYSYDELGRLEAETYSTLYIVDSNEWDIYPPESCGTLSTGMRCYYSSSQDTYTFGYDKVGNLNSKVRTTARSSWSLLSPYPISSSESTSWTYSHDDENRLETEKLVSYSGDSFRLTYEYENIYGYLSTITYPLGNRISYLPDVFGRPTRVGNIVSDVQYYDTGAIEKLTYRNGMEVNYTLNDRKLTETMQANISGSPLTNLEYAYDMNRNLELIQDNRAPNNTRDMGYDGLDRMTSANGRWGSGVYEYDTLSNFESKTIGGQTDTYLNHPTNNRLTQFNDRFIEYDLYGRITHDGNNRYFYDFSNNLTKATNLITDENVSYRYDANNRLQFSDQNYGERYVYSATGKLMYEIQRNGDLQRSHIYLGSRLVGYQNTRIECSDDSDDDGMPHCYERENNLNIYRDDATLDEDKDGISNIDEYNLRTLAGNPDSDGDGIEDLIEINNGLDPLVDDATNDADGDGFTNLEEVQQGSDPNNYTSLKPSAQFAAKFTGKSVFVSWYPVMHADGYDLYWSNTPFTDIESANLIENATSPYIHEVTEGEINRYYRLVTKKEDLRSEPTAQQTVDMVDKVWTYAGVTDAYVRKLGIDNAGNVHILNKSSSDLGEVSYWDNQAKTMSHFDIFDFYPRDIELTVAGNGDAMITSLYYSSGSLWASRFSPETKSWRTERIRKQAPNLRYMRNYKIVASENGHFVITWLESYYGGGSTTWVRVFSPETGWGPEIQANYTQESSSYLNQDPILYSTPAVNNQGDLVCAWRYPDTSLHLMTVKQGEAPKIYLIDEAKRSESSYNGFGSATITLSNEGNGILTWKQPAEDPDDVNGSRIAFSRRFDMQQLQGPVQSLEIFDSGIIAQILSNQTAAVFVRQDSLLKVLTQEGLSDWSDPIEDPFDNISFAGYENAYIDLKPGAIPALVFNNGTIKEILDPDYNMRPENRSGITSSGDFALQLWHYENLSSHLFIYQSVALPENVLPIANAGPDLITTRVFGQEGDTSYIGYDKISGILSSDQDGMIDSYQWSQVSGPEVYIWNPDKRDTYVSSKAIQQGVLEFKLTVTDHRGGQSSDTVTVTVTNTNQPIADFGQDQTVESGDRVVLDHSGTYDPDGDAFTLEFSTIEGEPVSLESGSTGQTREFTAPQVVEDTILTFRITITDDLGASDYDDVSVLVTATSSDDPASTVSLSNTSPYTSNDSNTGSVLANEDSLTLTGNRWRYIDGAVYTLTPDTVIEFDFSSDGLGEVQGIAFDNDNTVDNGGIVFNLIGSQNWGNRTYSYTGNGAVQSFSIPVGQFLTGDNWQLLIINDNDAAPNSSTVTVSNVRLCEVTCDPNPDPDPNYLDLSANSAYTSNDSNNGSVQASGNSLTLTGNRWRFIDDAVVTLTSNTIIEFDFSSDGLGEIQGIAFDNDHTIDNGGIVFKLVGSQNWGNQTYSYTGNGAVQSFSIPVGQYLTGDNWQLLIINDNDAAPNSSTVTINNVRLCEVTCDPDPEPDPNYLDLSANSAYTSNDSNSGSVQASGNSLTLTGNRWRFIDDAVYTLTSNSIIEFEFRSDGLGEIQGIAFDNDHTIDNGGIVFRLTGSQDWGTPNYPYTGNGAVQTFSIPVGQFLTGDNWQLLIINDNDAAPNSSTLTIDKVRICETSCGGAAQ